LARGEGAAFYTAQKEDEAKPGIRGFEDPVKGLKPPAEFPVQIREHGLNESPGRTGLTVLCVCIDVTRNKTRNFLQNKLRRRPWRRKWLDINKKLFMMFL
jgi:hypothetical protein